MKRAVLALVCLLPTTACASLEARVPPNGELITYETHSGPFCGRCDSLKIEAASDGVVWVERGHWAGRYQDWRTRRLRMTASPAQIAAFRDRLAPYRPAGELRLDRAPGCATIFTDQAGVAIRWRGGGDARLVFDYSCDPEARKAMAEALRTAPQTLGIRP